MLRQDVWNVSWVPAAFVRSDQTINSLGVGEGARGGGRGAKGTGVGRGAHPPSRPKIAKIARLLLLQSSHVLRVTLREPLCPFAHVEHHCALLSVRSRSARHATART